jgi:hypothetical protein
MRKTVLLGILLTCCAILVRGQSQAGSQARPDFTGTWKLNQQKSDLADDYRYALSLGEEGLTISQLEPELKLARRYTFGQTYTTIYTDGRAASNPDTTGETIKSITRWDGRKLISRYGLHRSVSGSPETVDVIDEWTISNDGKTLTLKTTMRYLQRGTDAGHREPFRGYVPRLWLKRVYDRT